jgi:hypothetical protein
MDGIVKIYLLSIDRRRFFFYADESEPTDDERQGDAASGAREARWRGWLLDRWHRLQWIWEHSEARAVWWTRRAWDWMHSWVHPDEAMLSRLRSAHRIELQHPASRGAEDVRKMWHAYLDRRWWRHLIWMSANGLAAPPALAFLWPLPGPNVIGYWFAYRAIHHALVLRGIRRVRRGRVEVALRPVAALDRPIERDEAGKATHAAVDGGAARLDEHVAWTESESPVAAESGRWSPMSPPDEPYEPADEES